MHKLSTLCCLTIACLSLNGLANAADAYKHDNHQVEAKVHSLSLNNGKKWQMDEHTRKMSKAMQKTFFKASHADLASLKSLAGKLDSQMNKLIQGCTMTGKAHDQLHVFLSEHIPTISAMKAAKDYQSARGLAIKLKGQFEAYKKYFE